MADSSSTASLRDHAETLSQEGKWDEAIAAWQQLEEVDPYDAEAAQEAARLIVARARRRVGLDGNDPAHGEDHPPSTGDTSIIPAPRITVAQKIVAGIPEPTLSSSVRDFSRSPLQQFETACRECPSHAEAVIYLAKLYLEANREYDAERL